MREYYPNFDWLRLILAVQVVAIHSGIAPTVFINPVPAFLAVSGFVVLGSIERNPTAQFFINRVLRVLPLLFVSFLVVGLLYGYKEMLHNIIYWLWPFGEQPINAVVWSLMYEEFYYVLLAIMFSVGIYKLKLSPILIGSILIVLTATDTFFGLPKGLFMLGGAFFIGNIAYIYRDSIKKINKWVSVVILLAIVAITYITPYTNVVDPDRAFLDFASFAAMLVFAIAGPQLPKLSMDISYSLYLIHCIVRQELLGYIPLGPKLFCFMLLGSLPFCYLSWHLIERPALKLKKRFKYVTGRIENAIGS